jgi:hypothetical protein
VNDLANGDRVKANQRGKIAFVVDMDKKHTAEQLLKKLTAHHKDLLIQVFGDAMFTCSSSLLNSGVLVGCDCMR